MPKKDKELKKYNCGWCQNVFEQYVGNSGYKHSSVSSQVVCPKCKNFIPTW